MKVETMKAVFISSKVTMLFDTQMQNKIFMSKVTVTMLAGCKPQARRQMQDAP
jgi:hypothetical protein